MLSYPFSWAESIDDVDRAVNVSWDGFFPGLSCVACITFGRVDDGCPGPWHRSRCVGGFRQKMSGRIGSLQWRFD